MKINNKTAMKDCLIDNNQFGNKKISADQIGAEDLRNWKELVFDLHKSAYAVYELCENNGLTIETAQVDLSAVFTALRAILSEIGEVNGHALVANAELATLVVGYSGKRGNQDSPALQLCLSQLRNREKELREMENVNGVNPEAIVSTRTAISELESQRDSLLSTPGNRIKKPTRTAPEGFRSDFERKLARVISNQLAKSWDELEEEAEARRKARRAKTKAKKAQAKTQTTSTNA